MIHLKEPDFKTLSLVAIDITSPRHGVEVVTCKKTHRVWVNVDGVCVFRACQIPVLVTEMSGELP